MTSPTFTILLAILRPPAMLPFAIETVLAQDRQDFELFIVCDGAPSETVACAHDFAFRDGRIRVFAHPKGARNGEAHRHLALESARGVYVCHIGDDDLWFPNHLSEIELLLQNADFGHLPNIEILPDRQVVMIPGHLANAIIRRRLMSEPIGFFGLSTTGYRLSAYRSLEEGWVPAPTTVNSDQYMWRKFLGRSDIRSATRVAVTAVKFASYYRREWPIEKRAEEVHEWYLRFRHPAEREALAQQAWASILPLPLLNTLAAKQREAECAQRETKTKEMLADLNGQLTGSQRQLAELREHETVLVEQLQLGEARHARTRAKLRTLRASPSWRLTRPFRWIARRIGDWQ